MKLLLTSVFGPYAVDDEFGRKENKMELFHNQITREQGIFSYRFNHSSFGLYFMAENLSTPTTVLDFPSLKRFVAEIKKGYTHVGISFIVPNMKKAAEMTRLVRLHAPDTKIILGGHGTAYEKLHELMEFDYVCKGEGLSFLRKLFNEPEDRKIIHPLVHSAHNRSLMGVPLPKEAGVLIPGVGCPNKCRFCATSHYFGNYIPFLETGRDIFEVCLRYEKEMGVTDFGVLDENFLKQKERMLELLALIEKHEKHYTFSIFSSAETLWDLDDFDILTRLGVGVIWIGVESKYEIYEKNEKADFKTLFMELQKRGISVLASAIMFLEHHDKSTIWEDVDFAINLRPEYLQFMELGPLPGTPLYNSYKEQGILLEDVPMEDRHGQSKIWFTHPHFTRDESEQYLKKAFERDYQVNGASFLRYIQTALKGYEYGIRHENSWIRRRAEKSGEFISQMRPFLFAANFFSKNESTKSLIRDVKSRFKRLMPEKRAKNALLSTVIFVLAVKATVFEKFGWSNPQPTCVCIDFNKENANAIIEPANCAVCTETESTLASTAT